VSHFQAPYDHDSVNYIDVGLWSGLSFTCVMLLALDITEHHFHTEEDKLRHQERMTNVSNQTDCLCAFSRHVIADSEHDVSDKGSLIAGGHKAGTVSRPTRELCVKTVSSQHV